MKVTLKTISTNDTLNGKKLSSQYSGKSQILAKITIEEDPNQYSGFFDIDSPVSEWKVGQTVEIETKKSKDDKYWNFYLPKIDPMKYISDLYTRVKKLEAQAGIVNVAPKQEVRVEEKKDESLPF